jgi:cytochrome P450
MVVDSADWSPFEVLPRPRRRRLGVLRFLRAVRDNELAVFGERAFNVDIGESRFLFQHFVIVNHPDHVRHVLLTNHENYPKGRLNRQILGPVMGQGLLTSEGEFWRRQRRIMAPAFHHQRLVDLSRTMTQSIEALLTRWQAGEAAAGPIEIHHAMMSLTMEIVVKTLFSHDIGDSDDALGEAITTILESYGRPNPADMIGLPEWIPRRRDPRAVAALAFVDRTILGIIETRRREGSEGTDLLGMLLAARDEETGEGMTDRQLRDEAVTLFAAGHETTANAMAWTFYLLAKHPAVEARLHEELDLVLGGRPARFEDLDSLPYTRMVIEESLRLFPPAFAMHRTALAEDEIGGVRIRPGSFMTISPYVIHRHARYWPEPERFDPERFTPDAVRERPRYLYIPFGAGPRICIGNGFALLEARLILATLAQSFRFRGVPGHPIEAHGRITIRPKYGLPMILEPR